MPITLLEASDNFFAYEPVLKALQASSEATLPMQDLLQVNSSGQVHGVVSLADCSTRNTVAMSCSRGGVLACVRQSPGRSYMSSGVSQVSLPEYLRGHTRWDLSMLAEPGHEAGV